MSWPTYVTSVGGNVGSLIVTFTCLPRVCRAATDAVLSAEGAVLGVILGVVAAMDAVLSEGTVLGVILGVVAASRRG